MNKLSFYVAIIAIIISLSSIFYIKSTSCQVYVDVNKLVDGYERTKVVRAEFENKAQTLNANLDSLIINWENELKTYEKERSKMSERELKLKQEILGNKQQQISSFQQAIQQQIQEEDKKATQTVINDINDYVKEYGKENGYEIIFGASGVGNIMYAEEKTDLTSEILIGLNEDFKGSKNL